MAFSTADLAKVLKRRYRAGGIPDATLTKFPLLTLLPKNNDFTGEYYVVPIKYGKQQGRSRTISDAIANNGNPKWDRWLIDVVHDYCVAQVPRGSALRTRDSGAFLKLFADQIDDAISVCDENLACNLYRTSVGYRGVLSATATVTADHIHLAEPTDVENFETGMVVKAVAKAGEVTLGEIDRENGLLYTANGLNWDNAANIPTIAASDGLSQDGDYNLAVSGLQDWLCSSRPTPASLFFGVDRYVDPRLYGVYYSAAGLMIEEKIKRALTKCARRGGRPDRVFMHPDNFADLEISLMNGGFLRRDTAKSEDGKYGFDGVVISYGEASAIAVADPKCTKDTAYGLEMSTWELTFMGPKIGTTVIDDDGQLIRVANADTYEIRCGNWCQLVCTKPGSNVRIAL